MSPRHCFPGRHRLQPAHGTCAAERYRINVFDWPAEFPQILRRRTPGGELRETASPLDFGMAGVPLHGSYRSKQKKGAKPVPPPAPPEPEWEGGFDVVIGTPPYVLLQDEFRDDRQLGYFRSRFASASYKIDTYHLFMEQAIKLAKPGGRCSMITPANFLTNNHLDQLRRLFLQRATIHQIVVIDGGVFQGISVDNAVFVVSAGQSTRTDFEIAHARVDSGKLSQTRKVTVSRASALADEHVLFTGTTEGTSAGLWRRIAAKCWTLGEIADVNFGKQLRDREKFTSDVITVASVRGIPASHRPCYTGRDVNRYSLVWGKLACLNDDTPDLADRLFRRCRPVAPRPPGEDGGDDAGVAQAVGRRAHAAGSNRAHPPDRRHRHPDRPPGL
jgi:hypothetical protein